jgi:hypothetical protein
MYYFGASCGSCLHTARLSLSNLRAHLETISLPLPSLRTATPPARDGLHSIFLQVRWVASVAGDSVFLQHHGDGLRGVAGRIALATALGAGDERLLELIGEAERQLSRSWRISSMC